MPTTRRSYLSVVTDGLVLWSGAPAQLRGLSITFQGAHTEDRFTRLTFQVKRVTHQTVDVQHVMCAVDRKKGCVVLARSDAAFATLIGARPLGIDAIRAAGAALPALLPVIAALLARNALYGAQAKVAGMDRGARAFFDAVKASMPKPHRAEFKTALRNLRAHARRMHTVLSFDDSRRLLDDCVRVDRSVHGPFAWYDGDGFTELDRVATAQICGKETYVTVRGKVFTGLDAADLLTHHRDIVLAPTNGAGDRRAPL